MEGYASLFDGHLSTVWSAPNYCYRCGNSASILEVGPGQTMHFNVFEAAPENERDGPAQQQQNNAKVCVLPLCSTTFKSDYLDALVTRVLLIRQWDMVPDFTSLDE